MRTRYEEAAWKFARAFWDINPTWRLEYIRSLEEDASHLLKGIYTNALERNQAQLAVANLQEMSRILYNLHASEGSLDG